MAKFKYQKYMGTKINPQFATHKQRVKEARRLASMVERRITRIDKEGYSSHAVNVLNETRTEIFLENGIGDFGKITSVSSSYSDIILNSLISAYDTYLKNRFNNVDSINEAIREYSELSGLNDLQGASKIFERIQDSSQSIKRLSDILGSDIIRAVFDLGKNPDGTYDADVGKRNEYRLAKLFEDYGDLISLNRIEEEFGISLR